LGTGRPLRDSRSNSRNNPIDFFRCLAILSCLFVSGCHTSEQDLCGEFSSVQDVRGRWTESKASNAEDDTKTPQPDIWESQALGIAVQVLHISFIFHMLVSIVTMYKVEVVGWMKCPVLFLFSFQNLDSRKHKSVTNGSRKRGQPS
jgi:hypothetical protein